MRLLICPYCFEKYPANQVTFRCINPNASRCPPEEDKAIGEYQRLTTPPRLPRVLPPPSSWLRAPSEATCVCGMRTTKLVCPKCHNELPSQFGTTDSYTIALIGAKEAGKSHYVAVLIHELTNRVGQSFNASLNALDEQTIQRYKQDFRRYIYEKREVIPATLSARALINVRYPLVYRFSLKRRKALFNDLSVSTLVFFDTAGEDLTHLDLMSTETKYLANSHGIIFLLDPLQIPAVRDQIRSSTALPSENTEPQEIIGRVVKLIRQSHKLGHNAKITTPIALAFSKVDAMHDLFEPSSPVHRAANHDGYFNTTEAQQVNDSMRAHVAEWVGPGLDLFLQHNFETFSYFGVSALGSPPDAEGRLPMGVAPFRVEDPLLWILHKLKIVPGRRN
jgi:GTPase SAR1 family protein